MQSKAFIMKIAGWSVGAGLLFYIVMLYYLFTSCLLKCTINVIKSGKKEIFCLDKAVINGGRGYVYGFV